MRTDNFDKLWAETKDRIQEQRMEQYSAQKSTDGTSSMHTSRYAKGLGGIYVHLGPLSGIVPMPREAIINLAAQCLDVVARIDQDNTTADNG